jgi:hypothetical protein
VSLFWLTWCWTCCWVCCFFCLASAIAVWSKRSHDFCLLLVGVPTPLACCWGCWLLCPSLPSLSDITLVAGGYNKPIATWSKGMYSIMQYTESPNNILRHLLILLTAPSMWNIQRCKFQIQQLQILKITKIPHMNTFISVIIILLDTKSIQASTILYIKWQKFKLLYKHSTTVTSNGMIHAKIQEHTDSKISPPLSCLATQNAFPKGCFCSWKPLYIVT